MRIHDALGRADHADILVSPDNATWTIADNAVTDTKLRDSAALSVIGRDANSSGDPADIAASADKAVLHRDDTALSFSLIDSTYLSDFDEAAQDAVGTILTNSAEIAFTYDDGVPSITASLINGSVAYARLVNATALSVLGRAGNISGVLADIVAANDGDILRRSGTTVGFSSIYANPSAQVGLAAVNGSAVTAMRSDGAPALSQAIVPTWTGVHTFSPGATAQVVVCNSTAAAGPFTTFQRNGNAFGDIGNGGQMGAGFNLDALALAARAGNRIQMAAGGATTPHLSINVDGSLNHATTIGQASITNSSHANGPYVTFQRSGVSFADFGNAAQLFAGGSLDGVGFTTRGADNLEFGTNTTRRLVVDSAGRFYGTALHNNATLPTGATNQYIASGTYTPTLTNVLNAPTLVSAVAQWMRVGNVVTVSGQFTVTQTANGATQVGISLPLASALTGTSQVGGHASSNSLTAMVRGDATNDRAEFNANYVGGGVAVTFQFTFTYLML